MQSKSTIDNHREISAALDFLRQASADDGAFDLDPRVVSGWVEMCLGALEVLVTAKRGKHADDKALKQTVEEHLEHAFDHANYALTASDMDNTSGGFGETGVDDDNLPHFDHATARIALLYARKAIVEQEAESDRALAQKIKEGANGLMQTTEGIVGVAAELYTHRAYPNSCNVDKLEHGTEVGLPWSFATYYQYPGKLHSVYLSTPTRPIETDNNPGRVSAQCVTPKSTPTSTWSPYVDDVKVTEATDVKRDYRLPGDYREMAFGNMLIGYTVNGARRGELVSVAIGGSGTVTFRDPCHGCSYAKWPNKGPGYSARCDKCKLDPNRPGYQGK